MFGFNGGLSLDGCLRLCNEDLIHYACFPTRNKGKLVIKMKALWNRKKTTEEDFQVLESDEAKRSAEAGNWLERVDSVNIKVEKILEKLSAGKRWGFLSCFCLRSNYNNGKELQMLLDTIESLQTQRGGLGEHAKLIIKTKPGNTGNQGSREEMQQSRGEDPWQLFCSSISGGRANVDDPLIQPYAKAIVSECRGLPLALAAVGRAVKNYQLPAEWETAIERLRQQPSSHQPKTSKLLTIESILRFCYDRLNNDLLRSCLLYCSLFPKNQNITETDLIHHWMGEGLLGTEDDYTSAYEKGLQIIRDLTDSSLLDYSREWCDFYVKMPKDVSDMAHQITDRKDEPYVIYSRDLSTSRGTKSWATATRVSIIELDPSLPGAKTLFNFLPSSDTTSLPQDTPSCLKLTTLLAGGNARLGSIHRDFFRFIPAVRVLDLSSTNIKEIPRTINLLSQLRYLKLEKTKITKLPTELGDMKNLMMLDLRDTKQLREIPSASIAGLSGLQLLLLNESAYSWELPLVNAELSIEVLAAQLKLDDLENLKLLKTVSLKLTSIQMLEWLFGSSIRTNTKGLTLAGECFVEHFVEEVIRRFSLRWFELHNCTKVEHIQIRSSELRLLQELKLTGLDKLSKLSSKDGSPLLPFLRHLGIWSCNSLIDLTWAGQLPALQLLCMQGCKQIKQLIAMTEEESAGITGEPFPKLQFLVLSNLPELSSFSWKHKMSLPFLGTLRVKECPKLKRLCFGDQTGKKIAAIRGSQEWWDKLQWDDDNIKSKFLPHFLQN